MEGRFASAIGFLGLKSGLRLVRMPRTPGSERDDPDQREAKLDVQRIGVADVVFFSHKGMKHREPFGLPRRGRLEGRFASAIGFLGLKSGLRLVRMPRTPGCERDDPDQREAKLRGPSPLPSPATALCFKTHHRQVGSKD